MSRGHGLHGNIVLLPDQDRADPHGTSWITLDIFGHNAFPSLPWTSRAGLEKKLPGAQKRIIVFSLQTPVNESSPAEPS